MASDDKEKKSESESKNIMGETLKKVLSVGVGAAFMTEESIRTYLGDLKLPKEILGILLQSANKGKDEITQRVSKELINIVSKIDWIKEVSRFAETHKFKISAEIDIVKKNNNDTKS